MTDPDYSLTPLPPSAPLPPPRPCVTRDVFERLAALEPGQALRVEFQTARRARYAYRSVKRARNRIGAQFRLSVRGTVLYVIPPDAEPPDDYDER